MKKRIICFALVLVMTFSLSHVFGSSAEAAESWLWPVPATANMSNHNIGSVYGWRVPPVAGASSYHWAIDIRGNPSMEIVASKSGTVSRGYSNAMGNFVRINHDNTYHTVYQHLSSITVTQGSYVKQGDIIGYMGTTGISAGVHLHFAIASGVNPNWGSDNANGRGSTIDPHPNNISYIYSVQPTTFNDGDFINRTNGSVYRIAGGAPIWVSDWGLFGGIQPYKNISDQQFDSLLKIPRPGTYINVLPEGMIYRFIENAHLYHIRSWDDVGGWQPNVTVDRGRLWAVSSFAPFGRFDSVTAGTGTVNVRGWAVDGYPNQALVPIHVYIGGPAGHQQAEFHNIGVANTHRADVNAAYPGVGNNRGFDRTIQTNKTGTQTVYVYAITSGGAGSDVLLGQRTVNISQTQSPGSTPQPPAATSAPPSASQPPGNNASGSSFRDVPTSFVAFNAIKWANDNGIVTGSNGMFYPNDQMTRAQYAFVLWRYSGRPPATGHNFTDVPSSHIANTAIAWASEKGIVTGSGNRFMPEDNMTRAQMVLMMYRYSRLNNKNLSSNPNALDQFSDRGQVPAAAQEAMRWAVTHGLMTGNAGRLMPNDTITRAQVVLILYRYVNGIGA